MTGETRIQKAERMAFMIADFARRNLACGDDDLSAAGFTAEEINDLRALANGFAAVMLMDGDKA